jgi:nucleoside-diphosphate-sugar epimerase
MEGLTVLGGRGFVGGQYVKDYYHHAVGNIVSVNEREDYEVHSPDVLYFISTVHNFHVFDKPFLDIDTNLTTLVKVLENWRKRSDSKDGVFNFISSWLVYGNQTQPEGVPEVAPCNPKGFYSITKRCAEQLLVSYCETYSLKYRILRLSNVIGAGDKKVSAQKNGLQYMVNKITRNEDVEIYGDGKFFRDFTHVTDCVRAIDLVISKGEVNSTYNIGNGATWYFGDIVKYVHNKLMSKGALRHIEPKDFQKQVVVQSFYMDTTKLKNLGYSPLLTGQALYDTLCEGK